MFMKGYPMYHRFADMFRVRKTWSGSGEEVHVLEPNEAYESPTPLDETGLFEKATRRARWSRCAL